MQNKRQNLMQNNMQNNRLDNNMQNNRLDNPDFRMLGMPNLNPERISETNEFRRNNPRPVVNEHSLLDPLSNTKGLNKEQFDKLKVITFKLNDQIPQNNAGKCRFCMEKFQDRVRVWELPCGHIFHFSCIREWTKTHQICPVCQRNCIQDDQ